MSIYAYMRTSTKTQAQKNGSQCQRAVISEYCEKNDMTIDGWFDDEGITGTTIERPELIKMLQSLKENDTVIVSGVSRLWRSESVKAVVKKLFCDKNVEIIDVDHPWYSLYRDETNVLEELLGLYVEFNSILERKQLVRQFSESRRSKAKAGHKPCGIAPYGYKWDGNEIIVDRDNYLTVIDIFEKYIEFRSLQKLKNYCDKKGYKTSSGKCFSKQALKNIIENDFYTGIVTYDGNKVKGAHHVFLSEDLYGRANEVLKR